MFNVLVFFRVKCGGYKQTIPAGRSAIDDDRDPSPSASWKNAVCANQRGASDYYLLRIFWLQQVHSLKRKMFRENNDRSPNAIWMDEKERGKSTRDERKSDREGERKRNEQNKNKRIRLPSHPQLAQRQQAVVHVSALAKPTAQHEANTFWLFLAMSDHITENQLRVTNNSLDTLQQGWVYMHGRISSDRQKWKLPLGFSRTIRARAQAVPRRRAIHSAREKRWCKNN